MTGHLVVVCPSCGRSAAAVVVTTAELELSPAGRWTGDSHVRSDATVPAGVPHQLVTIGCDRMDACGWLSELCVCQLRHRARPGRRPWRWTPTTDEQRDALRHIYGDDPAIRDRPLRGR